MTASRLYNSHPYAALLMMRGIVSDRSLTWSALEEFTGDLDRADAENDWQAQLLNAIEEEDAR
jgi:hypothetical protein